MAGDWIKIRGAIFHAPKLIAASRVLATNREFTRWALPGCLERADSLVSDAALRCLAAACLVKLWSAAREHGKFVGDDLLLPHLAVSDLDAMAEAPGVGGALESVGWAVAKPGGVVLPNFVEHNVPKSPAERSADYRRRRSRDAASRTPRDNRVTRVEKSREEKSKNKTAASAACVVAETATPPYFEFPVTVARRGPGKNLDRWPLTEEFAAELRSAYPNADLLGECRKMLVWLKANHLKTYTGMAKFVSGWMGRAQNQTRGRGGSRTVNDQAANTLFTIMDQPDE